MISQLWGPLVDLTGDGHFSALIFSWFTLKYANIIEMALVVVLFVGGLFVNLPGGREAGRDQR